MADVEKLSPEGRRHPSYYPAVDIHRFLVEDALRNHATELRWFVAAIGEIARQRRRGVEAVFAEVVTEVESLGGHMPLHSGVIS